MAKKSQKTTGKQRSRVKVGKLKKATAGLTKAEQKKVKGGLGDGSVRSISPSISNQASLLPYMEQENIYKAK